MQETYKLSPEELVNHEKELKKDPTPEEIMRAVDDVQEKILAMGCAKRKGVEIKQETANLEEQFENIKKLEIIGKNDLIKEVDNSDIVYISDYHSSSHHGDIIRYIINMSKDQNIVVGLETLDREENSITIPDKNYKKSDFYHNCTGMDIEKYQDIIKNIQEANKVNEETQIELIGLGNPYEQKKGQEETTKKENDIVAQKIMEMSLAEPMRKQIIFYGENHLAKNRMPFETEKKLKEKAIERKQLIIYHDIPKLYFQFTEENKRPPTPGEVVRTGQDTFCIFTEHPLKKELHCLYSLTTGKTPREIDLHDDRIKEIVKQWKADGDWSAELFEE